MTVRRIHLFLLLPLFLGAVGCYSPKALLLYYPDPKDAQRFDHNDLDSAPQPFTFAESVDLTRFGKLMKVDDCSNRGMDFTPLEKVLENHQTTGFLIVQEDTIRYEYHPAHLDRESLLPSYSLVKSFVSALVGIAIQEGKIALEDEIAPFFPELGSPGPLEGIRIVHLLNHTSGLAESLPMDSKLYYGHNLLHAIAGLKKAGPPGKVQRYLNVNTQLLGMILMRATGQSCTSYLQEKLWHPLGMSSPAFWSTDKKNGIEKTFCCLNATVRDFAKLGRLYLNGGNWNGEQVIAPDWIAETIQRDTTAGSSWGYNRSWYIGPETSADFMAIGLYKQYIYVHPGKKVVIVRMGNRVKSIQAERLQWVKIFRQIVDQL